MNKPVQILLLIALFPMIGTAREETLEERKQRIVRKYLRENLVITQSDMVVPSDLPEDERITDSEKFMDVEVGLDKHDASAAPFIPPPRPRPVPRADSNWLLDTDETADASDPYADPYASSLQNSGEDLWSTWDNPSVQLESPTRQDRSYNPYARTDSNQGMQDGRSQQNYSSYGQQQDSGYGSAYSGRTDLFGQPRQTDRSVYSSSGFNLQGNSPRTYGSDPSEGLLSSPYPQLDSSSPEEQKPGYQPYKSPYVQQHEQRSRQWGSPVQQPKQEYKRQDSYQQFKERNKTWNPTQDDAYTSELMQQPKR